MLVGCHADRRAETGFAEELIGVPIEVAPDGHPSLLQTTYFRPRRPGPWPLVILNHGAPPIRDAAQRRATGRNRLFISAKWFLDHGFAVAVPMRRGYAGSDGDYAEDYGACDAPDYAHAARETAKDIAAAVTYFLKSSEVQAGHIVVVGVSAGGLGGLAFAAAPALGAVAVINFSGGRGGRDPDGSGRRCAPGRLVDAAGIFGRSARLPTLWLYAENDSWFPPDLARQMWSAWHANGAGQELIVLPPVEDEGHLLFYSEVGQQLWAEPVTRFLRGLGYPVAAQVP
jgi:dienelactone hydrolase